MNKYIAPVDLKKAYRLINHGPTILVSAHADGVDNVMAASWCCALDFDPPKLTVVLDKQTKTREMIEKTGEFVIQVPTLSQATLVHKVGNTSLNDDAEKLQKSDVKIFRIENSNLPLVEGSSAWLLCRVIPEVHIQETYDLFVAEVFMAYADNRAFKNGHWEFDKTNSDLRSLHYIAGGQFYALGESINIKE